MYFSLCLTILHPLLDVCLSCAAFFKYTQICQFFALNPSFMKLVIFLSYACQFLLRLWEVFIRYGEIYGNFGGCRFAAQLKCIGLNWRQFSAMIIAGFLQRTLLNIQYRDVWKCFLCPTAFHHLQILLKNMLSKDFSETRWGAKLHGTKELWASRKSSLGLNSRVLLHKKTACSSGTLTATEYKMTNVFEIMIMNTHLSLIHIPE